MTTSATPAPGPSSPLKPTPSPLPETTKNDSCDETHAPAALPFPTDTGFLPPSDPASTLPSDSYTAHRLSHATPEHLHATSRRVFIGPIPDGWLKSHRRDWYKRQFGIHYSSRAATFQAQEGTGRRRALTGLGDEERRPHTSKSWHGRKSLERPHLDLRPRTATASLSASYAGPSFPQPDDVDDDEAQDDTLSGVFEDEEEEAAAEARTALANTGGDNTPAMLSPAATNDTASGPAVSRPAAERSTSERTVKTNKGPSMSARLTIDQSNKRPTYDRQDSSTYSRSKKSNRSTSFTSTSFVTANEDLDGQESVLTIKGNDAAREDDDNDDDARTETGIPPPDHEGPATILKDATGLTPAPKRSNSDKRNSSLVGSTNGASGFSGTPVFAGKQGSTTSLLPKLDGKTDFEAPSGEIRSLQGVSKGKKSAPTETRVDGSGEMVDPHINVPPTSKSKEPASAVTFDLTEHAETRERYIHAHLAQLKQRRTYKRLRRSKVHEGEIVKLANMLVRVEFTSYEMPKEFDENDSQKIELRAIDKWKEFMVVCRESSDDDAPFSLQLYKSRVISAIEKANSRRHSTHEIPLNRKTTRVNLFSSLDKTMVVWMPYRRGTLIYIMQARSGADSMEWYTFLRNVLGSQPTTILQVNVPDFNVNLRLDNPFEKLETAREVAQAAQGDDEAIMRTMFEEQAVAANIIRRCMEMLRKDEQWASIIDDWIGHGRIGLAWKRYDRLEWVYGANEQKMYGTIAMEKSYDLELRPKQHYPTAVKNEMRETLSEPPPVEGFLIRLTSQRGRDQRLGRLFFKRLYFSTHSNYLVFNRPNKADPPAPPDMSRIASDDADIAGARDLRNDIPLIYSVNPYPLNPSKTQITWLDQAAANPDVHSERDRVALAERERVIDNLINCDGLINLCNVTSVRPMKRGASPADPQVSDGGAESVSYHAPPAEPESSRQDDGVTTSVDEDRTFELVLQNDLTIRLQAYDSVTAKEWIKRLRDLAEYWRLRVKADIALNKSVRATNLQTLNVDEEGEALVGQFARKWEIGNSLASPELYHMCSIASCRTITLSSVLYRKPRHSAPFEKNLVILAHGHLLMYQDALRSRSGALEAYAHHDRVASLNLQDCYVYSGLVTENDLSGVSTQRGTIGSRPGHFALPRFYKDDGWSSVDEGVMCCFVVWHGTRRSWFRTAGRGGMKMGSGGGKDHEQGVRGRVKRVKSLGVTGRSVVFMCRSRAERDQWVLSLGVEIERLQRLGGGEEDVRLD